MEEREREYEEEGGKRVERMERRGTRGTRKEERGEQERLGVHARRVPRLFNSARTFTD